MKELLLLIDGNSLINRAFYALPPLTTQDGEPSQGVYGFCTMLIKAARDYKPTHAAVAFDLPAPTFRHKQYADYKGTRKGMPDELACQLPMLKALLTDMGIRILQKEGYEADDILGTMSDGKMDNIIITGDRDAFQLIDDNTRVAFTKKGISQVELYDTQKFVDEYGFVPRALVDYKALCGDSSDNIPGVAGIGAKTASALIVKYGSLDGVYQNLHEITGKTQEKLEQGRDMAYLSHRLAAIDRAVPLEVTPRDCGFYFPFDLLVRDRFVQYNFKTLAAKSELFRQEGCESNSGLSEDKADSDFSAEDKANDGKIQIQSHSGVDNSVMDYGKNASNNTDSNITDIPENAQLEDNKKNRKPITHIQIKSLDDLQINGDFAIIITQNAVLIGTDDTQYSIELADLLGGIFLQDVLARLRPLLQSESVEKTVLCGKSFMKTLQSMNSQNGEQCDNTLVNFFDIRLAQYVLDVNAKTESAEDFCEAYGYDTKDMAAAIFQIGQQQKRQLDKQGMRELYYNLELPLVPVLHQMETTGFKLDLKLNSELGQEFTKAAAELTARIHEECGCEFNLNSPKQLAHVLFEKMQIPYPKKSKTHSTAVDIIDPLRQDYPVVGLILDYRRITKLNGTYIEGFKKLADSSGVVHTDFKQTLTVTGRLSSAEPNLQNIPIREPEGRRLRQLFVARQGKSLVTADYSQIELRLLAHFSGDKTMTDAFNNDQDIHAQTAAQVFGVPLDLVTKEMRQSAKAVNFGIIYGISDYGLARNLGIPPGQARQLIETYFAKFSGIREYLDKSVQDARKTGYARTVLGRIRRIPELSSSNFQVRKFGERAAMNMPLQGSAADIIKAAMIRVSNRLCGMDSRLILQVHDELIIEANDCEIDKVKEILVLEMENVVSLSVPLRVSVGVGKNWLDT